MVLQWVLLAHAVVTVTTLRDAAHPLYYWRFRGSANAGFPAASGEQLYVEQLLVAIEVEVF